MGSHLIRTVATAIVASMSLAGCSTSSPTLGEQLTADAEARTQLARKASEGERLIARGEALVERGQKRVRRGEGEVSEGRELIERGERLLRDARREAENTGV